MDASPSSYTPLTDMLKSTNTLSQDLTDFFKKPYVLQTGVLSATDTVSTFSSFYVPSAALNVNQQYLQKLKGAYAFKGDIVITLQVNANKFQQGRYMVVFNPTCGSTSVSTLTEANLRASGFSIAQRLHLPHVELDINCQSAATLHVPFISTETGFSVANTTGAFTVGDIGLVQLVPYVPLATTAGSTTATYTMWIHFENISITGQTVYQSGEWKPKMKNLKTREATSNGLGPLSSISGPVAAITKQLGKIPMLTPFMGAPIWVTDMLDGAIRTLGFSKPLNRSAANYMERTLATNFCNVDGAMNAVSLALTSTAETEMLPGFAGTDEDEMSFAYLISKPSYISKLTWSTADAVGAQLGHIELRPGANFTTTTDSGVTLKSYSTIAYLQNFFYYWRGSMTFKFKIVKTEFHSGRLILIFNPFDSRHGSGPASSIYNSQSALRTVVDVQEGSEFEITVPYQSMTHFNHYSKSIGWLDIQVLDPLICPATVSTSISILVEVFGGPDMEFMQPRAFNETPAAPTAYQSGEWKPQCDMISEVIGGAKIQNTMDHRRACVGESINSFRQLVKRHEMLIQSTAKRAATTYKYIDIYPWTWSRATLLAGVATGGDFYPDMFTHLCSLYGMVRGSINVSLITANKHQVVSSHYVGESNPANGLLTSNVQVAPMFYSSIPTQFNDTNITALTTVNMPFHCQYHSASTSDTCLVAGLTTTLRHCPMNSVGFNLYDDVADKFCLMRSGGDDIQFGRFKSIPPYCSATVT